ncbi:type II toxin-antitoxin system HicB family antitoxin [Microvenator marinus]|nr:toxin-antitoxin system HicB family antitoxin [Microvenator marinus]
MNFEELASRYSYNVSWSPEDEVYIGRVVEWQSLAAHADSPEQALAEILNVVAIAIEDCEEDGDEYPMPINQRGFSGRFNVRLPQHLHRDLVLFAERNNVSLNQAVTELLSGAVAKHL